MERVDPVKAAAFNFFFPGTGYWIVRRRFLAVLVILISWPAALIAYATNDASVASTAGGWYLMCAVVGAIDALIAARKINAVADEAMRIEG